LGIKGLCLSQTSTMPDRNQSFNDIFVWLSCTGIDERFLSAVTSPIFTVAFSRRNQVGKLISPTLVKGLEINRLKSMSGNPPDMVQPDSLADLGCLDFLTVHLS
jgi:hypothetical protein